MKGQKIDRSTDQQMLRRNERALDRLHLKINLLIRIGVRIMSRLSDAVDNLEAKLAADDNAHSSVKTLLLSIKQMLTDALAQGGDVAALTARVEAVAAAIGAKTDELVQFTLENTPVADEEPPEEDPPVA